MDEFIEQLEVIRDICIGALAEGALDVMEVRQCLCNHLYDEMAELKELVEYGDVQNE